MDATPARPSAALRSRWDQATWNQLGSIDLRLIDELAYLCRLTAARSSTGARYCVPGRAWLAQRLGCSVVTITRRTRHLARLGMLSKLQRRPVNGRWQTCLYKLVHPMAWAIGRLRDQVTRVAHRLSQPTALASAQEGRVSDRGHAVSLREIIARGLARWGPASAE